MRRQRSTQIRVVFEFHGIVNSFDQPVLDASELTLPEMLEAEGYRTACIGKWHLG